MVDLDLTKRQKEIFDFIGKYAAKTGYPPRALATWAERARAWAEGGAPDDLKTIGAAAPAKQPRDVFVYMISGAKVRAPAAAMALIEQLK